MTGFPKSLRTIEIVQEVRYGFTLEYVEELCETWSVIQDYAYILHDKDVKEDGSPVEPHIHLPLRFRSPVPTSAVLAKLSGVCEIQHLERIKSWNSAMAYLTHKNRPDKHQYDDSEVISNFDWSIDRDKALSKVSIDDIVNRIASGEIREYNYVDYIPADIYARHRRALDNAWQYRCDYLQVQGEKNMIKCDVMWIWGGAGSGKTEFAKYYCRSQGMEYYISSSGTDPFGEYKGQRAVIFDDARPEQSDSSMLLKLLDPSTRSAVKSRYRNKWLECELIIITSPHSPEQWWSVYRQKESAAGSWEQLTRRLTLGSYHMTREFASVRLYTGTGEVLYEAHAYLPEEYYAGLSDNVSGSLDVRVAELEARMPGLKIDMSGYMEQKADGQLQFQIDGHILNSEGLAVPVPEEIDEYFTKR